MDLQPPTAAPCEAVSVELPGVFLAAGMVKAAFLGRVRGVDARGTREEVMARLRGPHLRAAEALGFGGMHMVEAEQVHGAEAACVDGTTAGPVPGVDALVTNTPGVCLVIAVADCAAVYLVEDSGRAIGLVHSGRRGTEANICGRTVATMVGAFDCDPGRLTAYISPCIRPPHFEVDFASQIRGQLAAAGVPRVVDSGVCTYSHPLAYYSYRREKGRTGRMLALLALAQPAKAAEFER